jgi:hypothetical protein
MRAHWALTLLFYSASCLYGQNPGSITTHGNCNGSATGSNITVIIDCSSGLSKHDAQELAEQYAQILNRIRKERLSFDMVNAKLDSIRAGVDAIKITVAPRRLRKDQIKRLKSLLTGHSPASLMVEYSTTDEEAKSYFHDFENGIGGAAFYSPYSRVRPLSVGLTFVVSNDFADGRELPDTCKILLTFLQKERIDHYRETRYIQLPSGDRFDAAAPCGLIVGVKPIK